MSTQRKPLFALIAIGALAVGLGIVAMAPSAEQPNPRKVFVEGTQLNAPWDVKMDFDNADKTCKIGDKMHVKITSAQDGYLYVFNQDPSGEIECIFPNSFQTKNEVKAGKEVAIGGDGKFNLRIGEPAGKELIIALVATQALKSAKPEDLIDVQKGLPKRITYRQAKKIYVEAVTGEPDRADNGDTVDKIKVKFEHDNPDKYKERAKEYSISQAEITTTK